MAGNVVDILNSKEKEADLEILNARQKAKAQQKLALNRADQIVEDAKKECAKTKKEAQATAESLKAQVFENAAQQNGPVLDSIRQLYHKNHDSALKAVVAAIIESRVI